MQVSESYFLSLLKRLIFSGVTAALTELVVSIDYFCLRCFMKLHILLSLDFVKHFVVSLAEEFLIITKILHWKTFFQKIISEAYAGPSNK